MNPESVDGRGGRYDLMNGINNAERAHHAGEGGGHINTNSDNTRDV